MRAVVFLFGLCVLGACTVSVPPPPDIRADLPTGCSADQIAVRGKDGKFGCGPQQALTVAQVGYANEVDVADTTPLATTADSAAVAQSAKTTAASGLVVLGQTAGPVDGTTSALRVHGGVRRNIQPVLFHVASFLTPYGNSSTISIPAGSTPADLFSVAPTFTLPARPGIAGNPADQYTLLIRASGVLTGAGSPADASFTTCSVSLKVTNSLGASFTKTVPVTATGRTNSVQGETPWVAELMATGHSADYTIQVTLAITSSTGECTTNSVAGQETDVEVDAF